MRKLFGRSDDMEEGDEHEEHLADLMLFDDPASEACQRHGQRLAALVRGNMVFLKEVGKPAQRAYFVSFASKEGEGRAAVLMYDEKFGWHPVLVAWAALRFEDELTEADMETPCQCQTCIAKRQGSKTK